MRRRLNRTIKKVSAVILSAAMIFSTFAAGSNVYAAELPAETIVIDNDNQMLEGKADFSFDEISVNGESAVVVGESEFEAEVNESEDKVLETEAEALETGALIEEIESNEEDGALITESCEELAFDDEEELLLEERMNAIDALIDGIDDSKYLAERGGTELFENSEFAEELQQLAGEPLYAADEGVVRSEIVEKLAGAAAAKKSYVEFPSKTYGYYDTYKSFYALKHSHPELFYLDGISIEYEKEQISGEWVFYAKRVDFTYFDSYDVELFNDAVDRAMTSVKPGMSDMEKAVVLHDFIVNSTAYDPVIAGGGSRSNTDPVYNAYGVFVNQVAVCNGYALAYQILLSRAGIDSVFIRNKGHAWNYVLLDGEYYNVDTTWDDPVPNKEGRVRHYHMFVSDASFFNADERHHKTENVERIHYGEDVTDSVKATSTKYDNWYWGKVDQPFVYNSGNWYYLYNNVLYKGDLLGASRTAVYNGFGNWRVYGSSAYYPDYCGSGLFVIDNKMYFNRMDKVLSYNFDTQEIKTEYEYNSGHDYLYGCAYRRDVLNNKNVLFLLGAEDANSYTLNSVPLSTVGVLYDTYSVEFRDKDGNILKTQYVETGDSANAPEVPTVKGYSFDGWDVSFDSVTSNLVVNALYSPIEYSITYVGNGGIVQGSPKTKYTIETAAFALPEVTRTGYDFAGWYTSAALTGAPVTNQTAGKTGNVTYYAKWSPKTPLKPAINPTSMSNIKSVTGGYITDSAHDFAITSSEADVKIYYTLNGSTPTNGSTLYTGAITVTTDTVIKAVAYRDNKAGEIMSTAISFANNDFELNKELLTVKEGETYILVADVLPTGAQLSDVIWVSGDSSVATVSSEGVVTGVYEGNTTITAKVDNWKNEELSVNCVVTVVPQTYLVTFKGKEGEVLKKESVLGRRAATAPEVVAPDGYQFTGWDKSFDCVESNLEVNALFVPINYSVTYNSVGGSAVSGSNYNIESEDIYLSTALTKTGYTFDGWFDNADYNGGPISFIPKGSIGNKVFYAKWSPKAPLKPAINPTSLSNIKVVAGGYVTDSAHDFAITSSEGDVVIYYTDDGSDPTSGSTLYTGVITVTENTVIKAVAYRDDKAGEIMSTTISFANSEFSINKASLTVKEGESFTLLADVLPTGASASDVTWMSSDDSVATVSNNGVVTGVYEGTTTITAKVNNWKDEELHVDCAITVEPQEFTVIFKGQGETVIKTENVLGRRAATAPVVDAPDGYQFTGWDKAYDNVESNLEVTAQFAPINYSIIYNSVGGSAVAGANYNVESEDTYLPTELTKIGYIFVGWFDNAEYSGNQITYIPKGTIGDKVFFAKWRSEKELWMRWKDLEYGVPYSEEYSGAQIKPEFEVFFGDTLLEAGKDYTATYKNNVNVNVSGLDKYKTQLIITGKGNYYGKAIAEFTIEKKSIESELHPGESGDGFDVAAVVVGYNGKIQKKAPVITWNGRKLNTKEIKVIFPETGEDAYKEEGEYDVVIEGIGNFTGAINTKLKVVKTNPNDPEAPVLMTSCKAKITSFDYSDSALDFNDDETISHVSVKYGTTDLECNTDYEIVYGVDYNGVPCKEVGKYTVIIRGKGKYEGEIRTTFAINGISAKTFVVDPIESDYYDGDAKEPIVSVATKAGEPLVEGIDYSVSYANNTKIGNAAAIITGIGAYTGVVKKTFKINPCVITDLDDSELDISFAEGSSTVPYMKNGATPKLVITYNGKELKEGIDYSLGYKNNKTATPEIGKEPYIIVTGKKNFKGTKRVDFEIEKADIGTLTLSVADIVENSTAGKYMSTPTIIDINGKKLAKKTDYKVDVVYKDKDGNTLDKYSKPVAGDVINVYVTGDNNYTGTISGSYRVYEKGKSVASAKISLKPEVASELVYNGESIVLTKDDLNVVVNKLLLTNDQYDIVEESYVNNINKGTASVTIVGKGDYAGTKVFKYTVKAYKMSWWQHIFG